MSDSFLFLAGKFRIVETKGKMGLVGVAEGFGDKSGGAFWSDCEGDAPGLLFGGEWTGTWARE